MQAIQFNPTIPRSAAGMILSRISKQFLWKGISCTYLQEIPEPALPTEDWVVVKTRYGGICGSDMSAVTLKASPYFSALASFPHTLGHENTGTIAAVGANIKDWKVGERVVVEPTLWCKPRGFKDLCRFCAVGEINRCERITQGDIAPSLSTGFCRDLGGSWSQYFLAHQSQLYRVPPNVSDENALMVEPFAVGLHAALENPPFENETILVIGAGSIGLCTIAALRALGWNNPIHVLARYPFQGEAAIQCGADRIITAGGGVDYFAEIADLTGARILKPILGERVMLGGYDLVFECVGSERSLDEGVRFTRSGGRVALVGVPGIAKKVDWSAIFIQELNIRGTYIYNHAEKFQGQIWRAFDLVLELMQTGKLNLDWMVTHRFALQDYANALDLQLHKAGQRMIKTVFEFSE